MTAGKQITNGDTRIQDGLIVSALVDGTPVTVHRSGVVHQKGTTQKGTTKSRRIVRSTTITDLLREIIAELESRGRVEITAISTAQSVYDDVRKAKRESRYVVEAKALARIGRLDLIPFDKRRPSELSGSSSRAEAIGREDFGDAA